MKTMQVSQARGSQQDGDASRIIVVFEVVGNYSGRSHCGGQDLRVHFSLTCQISGPSGLESS